MIHRRHILTGAIAAPFVARLGLLMPVRSIILESELYPDTDLSGVRFYTMRDGHALLTGGWHTLISKTDRVVVPSDILDQEKRGKLWRFSPAAPVRFHPNMNFWQGHPPGVA